MPRFVALLAGLAGAGLGFALGVAVVSTAAPLLGISSFEGADAYFAVFVGGPVGALASLVLAAGLVLRRAGGPGLGAFAGQLALVVVGVAGLGGAALAVMWLMRPAINPNGPAPQLVFEIRLPGGSVPGKVELQTSRSRMPGTVDAVREEEGRTVLAGRVEFHDRTRQRLLVLSLPDRTDVLFELHLGMSPAHGRVFGAWQPADHVAEPGKEQARRATAADRYEIRYRAAWAGEDG